MSFDVKSYGRDYQRLLALSSIASHLPLPIAYKVAGALGRFQGPLRWQADTYRSALSSAIKMPASDLDDLWRRWVDDHGAFCVNVFCHDTWDRTWFDRHVKMDISGLEQILMRGNDCLFLTYHHAFHHTLFNLLGLAGFRINVLAAPEETSLIYDQISPYIHRLHRSSVTNFNGGNYLFFNTPRQAVNLMKKVLKSGSLLISLNDFSTSGKTDTSDACHLLGRTILAPSGSIRLAQRLGVPIVAGIAIREETTYKVIFRQLNESLPHQKVMQSYFDFLAQLLAEQPHFWDGWNWFRDLPFSK